MTDASFVDLPIGGRIEFTWHGDVVSRPAIVMLHEGLGSLSMWRDFPARLAAATGRRVLAYSRRGYGNSAPLAEKWTPGYLHHEAVGALPELLDRLGIEAPVLFGHSDGGSIALIHAALVPRRVSAIVALAPHVKVEGLSVASIRAARDAYRTGDLRRRLARHHADVDATFWAWNDIWLDPAFRDWNIEALLPRVTCPVLAIQGEQDEYGTMEQVDSIARGAARVQVLKLAGCRHSPHRDQRDAVLRGVTRFLDTAVK
jgi:pimeloyl-ACP methyl ester carboxylesterase